MERLSVEYQMIRVVRDCFKNGREILKGLEVFNEQMIMSGFFTGEMLGRVEGVALKGIVTGLYSFLKSYIRIDRRKKKGWTKRILEHQINWVIDELGKLEEKARKGEPVDIGEMRDILYRFIGEERE